uniref:Uncharacterized protein n=1 Tax=Pipistrellus kuhlii TaxID=59472 RepID=A0A7J7UMB4_PIPKU|nr:hypothetical protein mPipKuh1_008764 [Pipistrellus kuhlii]
MRLGVGNRENEVCLARPGPPLPARLSAAPQQPPGGLASQLPRGSPPPPVHRPPASLPGVSEQQLPLGRAPPPTESEKIANPEATLGMDLKESRPAHTDAVAIVGASRRCGSRADTPTSASRSADAALGAGPKGRGDRGRGRLPRAGAHADRPERERGTGFWGPRQAGLGQARAAA